MSTIYQTKDGREFLFNIVQPNLYWSRFCKAIGHEELEHNPRFESCEARQNNSLDLMNIIKETILCKTFDE